MIKQNKTKNKTLEESQKEELFGEMESKQDYKKQWLEKRLENWKTKRKKNCITAEHGSSLRMVHSKEIKGMFFFIDQGQKYQRKTKGLVWIINVNCAELRLK